VEGKKWVSIKIVMKAWWATICEPESSGVWSRFVNSSDIRLRGKI
jgi:hypothetical protein